ncbi:hypothetical protein B0H14DRAFT_3425845 [Mycena olivaceomarginata]|nr:hypothetical protein B0H14DRAFT_3425845 [Mycena olivaceomarginata]
MKIKHVYGTQSPRARRVPSTPSTSHPHPHRARRKRSGGDSDKKATPRVRYALLRPADVHLDSLGGRMHHVAAGHGNIDSIEKKRAGGRKRHKLEARAVPRPRTPRPVIDSARAGTKTPNSYSTAAPSFGAAIINEERLALCSHVPLYLSAFPPALTMFVAAAEAGLLVGEEQATTSAGRRGVTSVRRGPYRASMRYILSFASLHTLIPSHLIQPVAAPQKTKGECEMKTLGLVVEVKCGQYGSRTPLL